MFNSDIKAGSVKGRVIYSVALKMILFHLNTNHLSSIKPLTPLATNNLKSIISLYTYLLINL